MLSVNDLHVKYGAIHALRGISLECPSGEIVALIGANGAGKSTALNTIIGLVRAESGVVLYNGVDITNRKTHTLVKKGISLVPEGRRIFLNLTVAENLIIGAYLCKDSRIISERMDSVFALLPRLKERYRQIGGTLSGGEQQMLAIARALMQEPKLLLLDEPSLGLAPNLVLEIFEKIGEINRRGTTILLVEQNAYQALKIADFAYVLMTGGIQLSGTGAELLANDDVRKAYLGAHD
jgi:branched-chain amino acid transport system ATP-binding protein